MRRTNVIIAVGVAAQACFFNPVGSQPGTDSEAASAGSSGATTPGPTSGPTTGAPGTTGTAPVCGDGVVEGAEACDDGNQIAEDACTNACEWAACGDGILGPGEVCDEGGASMTCDADCTAVACGDGQVNDAAGEACDDGNMKGGACSPSCTSTKIVDLSMGSHHTCAVIEGGELHCWGHGYDGKLGSEGTEDMGDEEGELPTVNVDAGGVVEQVACGTSHTCALLEGGAVHCWGNNEYGALGYGHTNSLGDGFGDMPTPVVEVGLAASQIGAGQAATCARTVENTVRCWGVEFAIGYPSTDHLGDEPGELPTPDLAGITDAADLSMGGGQACAVSQGGQTVWCWGHDVPTPLDLGGAVADVAVSQDHACALMVDGNVRCWGAGSDGKLGYGNTNNIFDADMPPPNVEIGGVAKQVVVGQGHTCALLTTGKVKCWGRGLRGALGSGSTVNVGDSPEEMPPPDVELGGDARAIFAHLGAFTCAVLTDESLRCWGDNTRGQLGYGHTEDIGDNESPASAGPVPF